MMLVDNTYNKVI